MFGIPLHYKVQGTNCMKKAVEDYFKLFEREITFPNGEKMSFKKYIKDTNYPLNPYEEQQNKFDSENTCYCGFTI